MGYIYKEMKEDKAMRRIDSYEEYRKISEDYRKASMYTNLFLFKAQIQDMIRAKKLFYMIQEENFFLFKKESGCYRMYYYITNNVVLKNLFVSDPIVVECIYRDEQELQKKKDILFLKRVGFVLGRRSCRMVLNSSDFPHKVFQGKVSKIVVSHAMKEDAERIFQMLWGIFDPLYAYLPLMDDLLEMIERKEILTAKDNGEVVGFLHYELMRGSIQIWHLAVDKKYRRMGVGSLLLNQYHYHFQKTAKFFMVWTDMVNVQARNLYQKAGYYMDNRFADEYVLLEEKDLEKKIQAGV